MGLCGYPWGQPLLHLGPVITFEANYYTCGLNIPPYPQSKYGVTYGNTLNISKLKKNTFQNTIGCCYREQGQQNS